MYLQHLLEGHLKHSLSRFTVTSAPVRVFVFSALASDAGTRHFTLQSPCKDRYSVFHKLYVSSEEIQVVSELCGICNYVYHSLSTIYGRWKNPRSKLCFRYYIHCHHGTGLCNRIHSNSKLFYFGPLVLKTSALRVEALCSSRTLATTYKKHDVPTRNKSDFSHFLKRQSLALPVRKIQSYESQFKKLKGEFRGLIQDLNFKNTESDFNTSTTPFNVSR